MEVTRIGDDDDNRLVIEPGGSANVRANLIVGAVAVTPSDTVDLATGATKGIYVGGAGNLKADMANGTTATFNALAVGVLHNLSVKRVYATGTTATVIVAVY